MAGVGVLGQLYMQASQMDVSYLFERFWLGMFLFYIPAFWRLLSPHTSRSERLALLIGTALFSYVPKLFRCPNYFCYSDELTWWRGVQNLLEGSPVLSDNPLGLIQGKFPGLLLLTIVLQKASGFSTFEVGLVLMGMMRALTIVSIFLLGEKIFRSSRVGAAAALVYMMNANFLFFSSQFSYESLAVPLLLVTLLFFQYLVNGEHEQSGIAWRIVILLCITAIVITHHLATYMMIAMFILMVVLAKLLPRFTQPESFRQLLDVTFYAIVAGIGWLLISSTNVVEYLGDPISRGIEQVASRMIRRLFSGIPLPWYEIGSGYASAILIVLLALFGALIILRKRQVFNSVQIGLLSFGSLYIMTAPLVLTPWGAESGRRSWVYSFIGLSLLAGFALDWLASSDFIGYRRYRRLGMVCTTVVLALLLLGGIASSTSISYRFPGPYLQNSDARSFTPEIIDAAQWMLNQVGSNHRVLGDRTTERIFGSYGLQEPAMYGGPRPWEVFFPASWTSDALYWLGDSDAPFVVVDKRMAELLPQMDFRFQRNEPSNTFSNRPIPVESVEKFDELPALDRIYDSGNIRIYHLNNTGHSIFELGKAAESSPVQNLVDTNEAIGNHFNAILKLLLVLFRCIFLVILILFIPGYIVGNWLFPDWSDIENGTRVTLAVSMSISMIILFTLILALLLSNVENAAIIVLFFFGLLLAGRLIQFFVGVYRNQSAKDELLSKPRKYINEFRQKETFPVCALGFISVLLVVFLMGQIKPRYEPRTDLAFDFSSVPPSVQITNLEEGEKTYQLIIYGEGSNTRISQQLHLNKNQTFEVNLQRSSLWLPSQGKIYLDLYLDGQEKPYRSIYFLQEEAPTESRSILKEAQGN